MSEDKFELIGDENVESTTPNSTPLLTSTPDNNLPDFEQLGKLINNVLNNKQDNTVSNLFGGLFKLMLESQQLKNNIESEGVESEGVENEDVESEDVESEDVESEDVESEKDESEKDESENDESEDDESEKDESEKDESEKDESEKDESEDENSNEIYLIIENKKYFNYATDFDSGKKTMNSKFHFFLEQNTNNCLNIQKDELKYTVYERNPNSLSPYNEKLVYEIEMFTITK